MDDTKKDAGNITVNITPYPTTDGIVLKTARGNCTVNAFYIPRSAIHSKFIGERPSELFDNYGIYFLYRNENKEKGLDAKVYVGKVGERHGGIIQRLKEHDKENKHYQNDWDCALVLRSRKALDGEVEEFNSDKVAKLESIYYYKLKDVEAKANKNIALNENIPNGGNAKDLDRVIEDIDYYLDTYIPTVFSRNNLNNIDAEVQEQKSDEKTDTKTVDLDSGTYSIPQFTTPTDIVKQMVDMLPDSVWNPDTKFLDPACKGGEFLKELFNRLMDADSLKAKYPDKTARTLHILNEQLYGVALSKESRAETLKQLKGYGNIILVPLAGSVGSSLVSGLLRIEEEDTEYYKKLQIGLKEVAYLSADSDIKHYYVKIGNDFLKVVEASFRSMIKQTEFTRRFGDEMKFDVVIGNPPYQESFDGCNQGTGASIYQHFVTAFQNADNIAMVIPNKWYNGNRRLDNLRKMLNNHLKVLVDFENSQDIFGNSIKIGGGICYFLYSNSECNKCNIIQHINGKVQSRIDDAFLDGVVIIDSIAKQLLNKCRSLKNVHDITSSTVPFGIATNDKGSMTSIRDDDFEILVTGHSGGRTINYYPHCEVNKGIEYIDNYKLFLPTGGEKPIRRPYNVYSRPIVGKPNQICNGSYLVVGRFSTLDEAEAVYKYACTKFFRCLVQQLKTDQHIYSATLKFVPLQDFTSSSDIDWSQSISDIDNQLYKKYNLSPEEIAYIEKTIKPMN